MAAIPKSDERQFALVLALVGTERGLSRDEICEHVSGYSQRYEQKVLTGEVAVESLHRLFERDKAELRDAGIDIETVPDPSAPDDNKLARYRVRRDQLERRSLRFDKDEAALLELAALVWERGAMAGHAANSVAKLRALDIPMTDPSTVAAKPRLRSRDHGFEAIADAIADERAIGFRYRKQLADGALPRRIEPQALLQFDGHWLAVGYDLDRQAERRFVLSRIEGPIRGLGPFGGGRRHDPAAGERARRELEGLAAGQRALLALRPGGDAEVRLGRRGLAAGEDARGWPLVRLGYSDVELLADELAGYGPELVALEPAALRAAVIDRLERTLAAHVGNRRP